VSAAALSAAEKTSRRPLLLRDREPQGDMILMKYFTPELFIRLQDLRDEAAIREWERVTQEYTSSLADVLPQLPAPLRQITKQTPLHDADVLSMTQLKDTLAITVQPELSADVLILSYRLVESPVLNRAALPPACRSEPVSWLYDELGVERIPGPPSWRTRDDRARGDGRVTVATHNILLGNGWEVGLKFRRFRLIRPETYIPSSGPAAADQQEMLPRSA
jgi:hypothetical protein